MDIENPKQMTLDLSFPYQGDRDAQNKKPVEKISVDDTYPYVETGGEIIPTRTSLSSF